MILKNRRLFAFAGVQLALAAWGGVPVSAASFDYPRDRVEPISSASEIQGVAHDERSWYISNTLSVTRVPLGTDLNSVPGGLPMFRIPADMASVWNHIGDVDYAGGMLFAPLEGGEPTVCIVDPATMKERFRTRLSPRGDTAEIPWVAIDPLDGELTTSTFNLTAAPLQQLRVYAFDENMQAKLDHTTVLVAADGSVVGVHVAHVQGGAFSKNGNLYFSSDADDGGNPACNDARVDALYAGCHGLYVFGPEEPLGARSGFPANAYGVPTTMRRFISFEPIERKTKKIHLLFVTLDVSQEIEGLDVFDLAPGLAPGISGLAHVMMSHADSSLQHSFWFKHFDLSDP